MTQFARRMDEVTGSAIRELFHLLSDKELISFGGGNPARESFPVNEIRKITDDILSDSILQYGGTEGLPLLREMYLEHMVRPKGVKTEDSDVLILTGSMQGINLICEILLDPGDAVLVEAPTFLGTLQTMDIFQADKIPVPMDENGVLPDELEALMKKHRPKMFYCIPTFQNPSGITTTKERRERIAKLAHEYGVLVVEDDPYGDLRYAGEPIPPIKYFDKGGDVLLLNSFSKIISPGIRVGCAFGKPEIIRKMTIAKQSADTHTSNLSQGIAAEFLRRGLLPEHLKRINAIYSERLNAMLAAMDMHFPKSCTYTRPQGGLFVWGELPEGCDATALLKRATSEEKVAYIPGQHFFTDKEAHKNAFRLNFSCADPEQIRAGIERLGKLFSQACGE